MPWQGLSKSPQIFEEKMAAEGLKVKVKVYAERKIPNESMNDQAELILYGNWRRRMWLNLSAAIVTLLIGLGTAMKYTRRGQQLYYRLQGSNLDKLSDGLSRPSSSGPLSHSRCAQRLSFCCCCPSMHSLHRLWAGIVHSQCSCHRCCYKQRIGPLSHQTSSKY